MLLSEASITTDGHLTSKVSETISAMSPSSEEDRENALFVRENDEINLLRHCHTLVKMEVPEVKPTTVELWE